jgi:hypothetical protein
MRRHEALPALEPERPVLAPSGKLQRHGSTGALHELALAGNQRPYHGGHLGGGAIVLVDRPHVSGRAVDVDDQLAAFPA